MVCDVLVREVSVSIRLAALKEVLFENEIYQKRSGVVIKQQVEFLLVGLNVSSLKEAKNRVHLASNAMAEAWKSGHQDEWTVAGFHIVGASIESPEVSPLVTLLSAPSVHREAKGIVPVELFG